MQADNHESAHASIYVPTSSWCLLSVNRYQWAIYTRGRFETMMHRIDSSAMFVHMNTIFDYTQRVEHRGTCTTSTAKEDGKALLVFYLRRHLRPL